MTTEKKGTTKKKKAVRKTKEKPQPKNNKEFVDDNIFDTRIEEATSNGEMQQMFAVASENLINYRKIVLETDGEDEVASPVFHYTWSDILLSGTKNYAIEGYRESGKSSIVQRSFPLYCLTFARKELSYIVLVKNTTTLARAKLKEIEREYLGNPLCSARLVKIVEQSADAFHVILRTEEDATMEFRIEAFSKGSSIRGIMYKNKRPDIIIIDDAQDLEDARSETVCTADFDWFLSDIYFLGRKTRIFMIANNLGDKCIIERIFASPEAYNFETMRVPVMDENGNPTWPERDTKESIEKERENFDSVGKLSIWMREKMCVAVAEGNRVIKEAGMCYYHPSIIKNILASCSIFTVIDLATGTKATNDFTAIVTVAVNEDNHWFVIDCDYGRWISPEIITHIIASVRNWRPNLVGIEKGSLKNTVEPFLRKAMAVHNTFFNLVPIDCKQSKEMRVELALAPRFDSQTIHLPETAPWLAELKTELLSLTRDEGFKSLHDDLCFIAGTKIATSTGDRNIEDMRVGDYVITPIGLSRVTGASHTGKREVMEKFNLTCTPNHPIWNNKHIAFIDALAYTDDNKTLSKLNIKELLKWMYRKALYLMESPTDLWVGKESIIYLKQQQIVGEKILKDFTLRFGNMLIRGQFRKVFTFTMLMVTHSIMMLRILSAYHAKNMQSSLKSVIRKRYRDTWQRFVRSPKHGIGLKPVVNGIANMLLKLLRAESEEQDAVMFAENNIVIPMQHRSTVLPNVTKKSELENVYNLSVENVNCYYANSVLVGNCDALAGIDQIANAPINTIRVRTQRQIPLKAKCELEIF